MKIKCLNCETIYDVDKGTCPSCGRQGGYMQEPKIKNIDGLDVHLEEVLIHTASNNKYQIKEIQAQGLIAILVFSPVNLPIIGKRIYISNTTIEEYKVKKY